MKISRILARNVLTGDKFALAGSKKAGVVNYKFWVRGRIILQIKRPDGKTFERKLNQTDRVCVSYNKKMRSLRKKMSRIPLSDRQLTGLPKLSV